MLLCKSQVESYLLPPKCGQEQAGAGRQTGRQAALQDDLLLV